MKAFRERDISCLHARRAGVASTACRLSASHLSPLPRLCWICITDDRVRSAGIRSSRDCFLSRMGFDVTAGAPRLRFNRMV
jgi:hypothetical protein